MGEVGRRPVVRFYFAPGSRYCYLAASQIQALERETGCAVDWVPVDGREIRALRGRDPFEAKPSGQYEWDYRQLDAERWAAFYGVPYQEPRSVEMDFRLLVRAAMAARRMDVPGPAYAWPLCRAVYAEGRWPVDRGLCIEVAERAGLGVAAFERSLDEDATERAIQANAAQAHARGAFGVPTFFLGDQLFWGNDRLPLLRHALKDGYTPKV